MDILGSTTFSQGNSWLLDRLILSNLPFFRSHNLLPAIRPVELQWTCEHRVHQPCRSKLPEHLPSHALARNYAIPDIRVNFYLRSVWWGVAAIRRGKINAPYRPSLLLVSFTCTDVPKMVCNIHFMIVLGILWGYYMFEINRSNNQKRHHDRLAGILNDKVTDFTQSKQNQKHGIFFIHLRVVFCINIAVITCVPILPGGFLLRGFYQTSITHYHDHGNLMSCMASGVPPHLHVYYITIKLTNGPVAIEAQGTECYHARWDQNTPPQRPGSTDSRYHQKRTWIRFPVSYADSANVKYVFLL